MEGRNVVGDDQPKGGGINPEILMPQTVAEGDDLAPRHVGVALVEIRGEVVGGFPNRLQGMMADLAEGPIVVEVVWAAPLGDRQQVGDRGVNVAENDAKRTPNTTQAGQQYDESGQLVTVAR